MQNDQSGATWHPLCHSTENQVEVADLNLEINIHYNNKIEIQVWLVNVHVNVIFLPIWALCNYKVGVSIFSGNKFYDNFLTEHVSNGQWMCETYEHADAFECNIFTCSSSCSDDESNPLIINQREYPNRHVYTVIESMTMLTICTDLVHTHSFKSNCSISSTIGTTVVLWRVCYIILSINSALCHCDKMHTFLPLRDWWRRHQVSALLQLRFPLARQGDARCCPIARHSFWSILD